MTEQTNSHMPFLTSAPSGDRVLLFCQPVDPSGDPVVWKVFARCGEQVPFRLETGFSDRIIECSPTAWHDESGWHLSFVAGGDPANPSFHLYRMDGLSLQRLSPPVALKQTRVGFVYKNRLVSADKNGNVFVYDPTGDHVLELPKMEILRISYMSEAADVLLMTCRWQQEDEICTVAYDLNSGEQNFIEADGEAVYKPTLFGGHLLHAERVGDGFEERRIRSATKIDFRPCKLVSLRPPADLPLVLPDIEIAEQGKNSDLASVEKHLGAAFVLASEIANGHAYRMRFVGHLHEAEDESLGDQALHRQIRQMRKNYQKTGVMPDWELLARTLYESMNDS